MRRNVSLMWKEEGGLEAARWLCLEGPQGENEAGKQAWQHLNSFTNSPSNAKPHLRTGFDLIHKTFSTQSSTRLRCAPHLAAAPAVYQLVSGLISAPSVTRPNPSQIRPDVSGG